MVKAWGVQFDQISGPAWLSGPNAGTFDLTATMSPNATQEQFQRMLQNLLIDRFQIKLHHETHNFPGYELTVAPAGPKFKSTAQDPNAPPPDAAAVFSAPRGADGLPTLPPGPMTSSRQSKGRQRAQFQSRSMAEFRGRIWEIW